MPEKNEKDSAETAEQKSKRLEAENEQLRAEIAVLTIDSIEGYEGKAAEKSKIVFDFLAYLILNIQCLMEKRPSMMYAYQVSSKEKERPSFHIHQGFQMSIQRFILAIDVGSVHSSCHQYFICVPNQPLCCFVV